ncbi:Protein TONNEAU 1a [Camellia lanceoleosa]|uniref:Protein TONNEAU 1a n=1 Tax=Camellia lanceoleosa TaxID=1840588 RepID=A0ACC0GBM2_9ERIC|nr:Protein TONNEAU 1a [Camellia lanceoleosa]
MLLQPPNQRPIDPRFSNDQRTNDQSIQEQGRGEGKQVACENHHGICAICLNNIVLQETTLVKRCEHAYCWELFSHWVAAMTVQNNFMLLLKVPLLYFPPFYSHDFGTGVTRRIYELVSLPTILKLKRLSTTAEPYKDSWKAELKEFSSNNGYDLNKNGDSAPLLLDVLKGFLKYRPFYNVSPGRHLTVVRKEDGSSGDGEVL